MHNYFGTFLKLSPHFDPEMSQKYLCLSTDALKIKGEASDLTSRRFFFSKCGAIVHKL
jgi:hypothetical protein